MKEGVSSVKKINMQKIYPTSLTPEKYNEQQAHKQVQPPENCPNCDHANSLEALCYYSRNLTQTIAAVMSIMVRRFRCLNPKCKITVSCLPQFAQPYRLVNTSTVEAGFARQTDRPEVARWQTHIRAYWRRFEKHLPTLLRGVGNAFGSLCLTPTARQFWDRLLERFGDLAAATQELVHQFCTCLFGTYCCHQRKLLRAT